MNQHYLTPGYIYYLRTELSDRDLAVVKTLGNLRLATSHHIQKLHFTTGIPASNTRMCFRSLERLARLGIVCKLSRRVQHERARSTRYIYQLDRAGQAIAGTSKRRVFPPRDYHYLYIDHTLAITELYVRLMGAAQNSDIRIGVLDIESHCWRKQLRPDAYLQVVADGFRYYWFIEMDMATQPPNVIRNKLAAYQSYWETGEEERVNRIFPKVLFLVPDEDRKQLLERIIQGHKGRARRLFLVALQSEALPILTGGPSL